MPTSTQQSRHPHRQAQTRRPELATTARSASVSELAPAIQALIAEVYASRVAFPIQVEELPMVVACRTVIADTVMRCPLVEFDEQGHRAAVQSPLIEQPDPFEFSWLSFHRFVMNLGGDGNQFLMVTSIDMNTNLPLSVKVLPSAECTPIEAGQTREVLGCRWLGRDLYIAQGQVIHVPMHVTGKRGRLGQSPLRMSAPAFESIANGYKFASSTWSEFGAPSVKIKLPFPLQNKPAQGAEGDPGYVAAQTAKEQADEIRASWADTHGGKRVPFVSAGGADVEPFATFDNPADLALLCEIISADAPRAYLIPPSIVNAHVSSSLTYATVSEEFKRWKNIGLSGYFTRIEAAFTAMLPRGRSARFDTSVLDAPEMLALWEALVKACGGPFMSTAEAREIAKGASPSIALDAVA